MPATRTYAVTPNDTEGKTRLIEATTASQALRHVAKDTLGIKVVGGLEVGRLMESGVKLERAAD